METKALEKKVEFLTDCWYVAALSSEVPAEGMFHRRILDTSVLIYRKADGVPVALHDRCPHRFAPLHLGKRIGDDVVCAYHALRFDCSGACTHNPHGNGLIPKAAKVRSFPLLERYGFVWIWMGEAALADPAKLPDFGPLDEGPSTALAHTYIRMDVNYELIIDNVMDPMHGVYLHKQSHTMAEGENTAEFQIRDVPNGFIFEKKGQRDVNFDWTEWTDTGIHTMRLEIPYPKTGGPGGNFTIIGAFSPAEKNVTSVFFWRCRKVQGWQRDTWRFLYKNRLEERHWNVLEQDRVAVENMEPDANKREHLYAHDMGIVRLRRHLRNLAKAQLDKPL